VFCTALGGELLAGNVRRTFRRLTGKAGIGDAWTPRVLRHSFVSLLSSTAAVPPSPAGRRGRMDQIFDTRKGGGRAA